MNFKTCLVFCNFWLSYGKRFHQSFLSQEKGNTPLHVAASAGQATQCELLIVHGADPSAFDLNEKTAAMLAMESGNTDLCYRLVELAYELTDRLTYYLCGRRPDHKNGINYLIPALQDRYKINLINSLKLSYFGTFYKYFIQVSAKMY